MNYEPSPGETIAETAKAMVALVVRSRSAVTAKFNDIQLAATIGTGEKAIVEGYEADSRRRSEKYRASPAGQKAAREAEEFHQRVEASAAEGIKPFSVKDAGGWQKCIDNNKDDYGACCVRYAARWANLMDRRMAVSGRPFGDIADETSHEVNTEGITGFMYGCAVLMLAQVWEHGESLRRWHNLKTQFHNEGEKANESGGVLNPALLNVG